jgi:Pectate lyase superfamily protein
MPNKSIPAIGDSNWGTPLNAHLSQLQNPTNGGINAFEQFSQRPTNLTADDTGKTYLYTQTGNLHQWTGAVWKILNESVINVKDYGAIGDGTDATTAIQFCLDKAAASKGTVYLPNGGYPVSKPLEIASFVTFYGESMRGVVITKNSATTGIGGFNSVIILKKSSDSYNSYSTIRNMFIGSDVKIDCGILCEQGSAYLNMSNLYIYNVKTGFASNDSFLTNFSSSIISEVDTGIKILAGTSLVASDIYCSLAEVGFWIGAMTYTTFNSCAADGISNVSYKFTNSRGITLNSCGSEVLKNTCSSVFQANNSFININAPFVVFDDSIMDKAVCHATNNSRVLMNNLCLQQIDSKFIFAESNSIITVDEVNNTNAQYVGVPFLQSDKYVETTGGKILTPKKQSSFVNPNNNFANSIKSVSYNSTYPTGNNDYNENLSLNLTNEITNLVGANWIKARITFQGNDFTNTSGYAVIEAFQTNGFKSFALSSANAGATLVGDILKIPTITIAGGGYWFKMQGIYEITISV